MTNNNCFYSDNKPKGRGLIIYKHRKNQRIKYINTDIMFLPIFQFHNIG